MRKWRYGSTVAKETIQYLKSDRCLFALGVFDSVQDGVRSTHEQLEISQDLGSDVRETSVLSGRTTFSGLIRPCLTS